MKRHGTIRVLHVVGGMNRGGAETWLMHVLRHGNRERVSMDFLVHATETCAYDEEIRAHGARIVRCPGHRRTWSYARRLRRLLAEHGPFDVVHSHVHHYSGFVLRVAARAGVPCRVAHSHQDTRSHDAAAWFPRKLYIARADRLVREHATAGLAASQDAAVALFGPDWERDGRWKVLYYGIDVRPFFEGACTTAIRSELGLPRDAFVLGHVGRFRKEKNHEFLVAILQAARERDPRSHLVLIGDGPLRPTIESRVRALRLQGSVTFLGARSDVPRLLTGAMDVFVLPSHREGLPLVALEAQAAGTPILLPDDLTSELEAAPFLVHRLSRSASAADWAAAAISLRGLSVDRVRARSLVEESPFSIRRSAHALSAHYHTALGIDAPVEPAARG